MRILNDDINKDEVAACNRSSEESNIDLMSVGYTVLTEKQPREFDFEVFYDVFLLVACEAGPEEMAVDACDISDLLDQVQPSSSCELFPLNTLYGVCIGSKKDA